MSARRPMGAAMFLGGIGSKSLTAVAASTLRLQRTEGMALLAADRATFDGAPAARPLYRQEATPKHKNAQGTMHRSAKRSHVSPASCGIGESSKRVFMVSALLLERFSGCCRGPVG